MHELAGVLADAGLDVVHRFDLRALGIALPLPDRAVGIVVGNTRAMWPTFLAARRDEPDPLDRHVERALDPFGAIYAHRQYDGAWIPIQRVAIATGLAAATPCGLIVHPVFGQWFGLRAILAIDGEPPITAPIEKPCSCTSACGPPKDDSHWDAWLAVRDACTIGRTYRYGDEQIAYHYTKDPAHLRP